MEEEEEEEEEKVEEDSKHEKEVKSILKTDRNEGDPGYKAVWFKTDVDPSGENVEVINDDAADYDDDSDQDLQENEKEEEDLERAVLPPTNGTTARCPVLPPACAQNRA